MGKKLDALLGKCFKTSKFKSLVELLASRIAALEKQHRLRCIQSQCDIIDLLKLGHQESALLRVELVIAEQNILDAYTMIENYCVLLVERVVQIESNRECPNELKEAISSLIFAASKCGELPELEKIGALFAKRFGNEFATNAVDLCNNCGVCPKIVSKLSTQRPDSERKLALLKEIAIANKINLNLEGDHMETKMILRKSNEEDHLSIEQKNHEKRSEEVSERKRYKDFNAAAKAAYKLASRAAVAARIAVELSRPLDEEDQDRPRKSFDRFNHEASKSEVPNEGEIINHDCHFKRD